LTTVDKGVVKVLRVGPQSLSCHDLSKDRMKSSSITLTLFDFVIKFSLDINSKLHRA